MVWINTFGLVGPKKFYRSTECVLLAALWLAFCRTRTARIDCGVTRNAEEMRCFGLDNRANYRLDGILPIVNLIDLPLEDKDRVEALKGASALYYGFTTPGGIINLTMKRPTPDAYAALSVFGNEYGAVGGHIDVGDTWGPFGARINALYGNVDYGIEGTPGYRSLLAGAFDFKPRDRVMVKLDAEHILKYVGERAVNQFNQAFVPGYTLIDLGAAYTRTFPGIETTMRITGQNIADRKYFSSTGENIIAQGPPRLVKFSITTHF